MQETESQLQGGEDLKKELDVLPSWGKTGQLVVAQFRGPGWRIPVIGNLFYIQANLSACCMGSLQMYCFHQDSCYSALIKQKKQDLQGTLQQLY